MENISRRNFLKGALASAGAVAASGLLKTPVFADEEKPVIIEETDSYKAMSGMNPQDYTEFRKGETDLSALFTPWKFGGLTIGNRMVKSAAGSDTQNGSVDEAVSYYANFARGGVKLVWAEDFLKGKYFPDRPLKITDEQIKAVIKGVHDEGSYFGYQLSCMGYNAAEDLSYEEVKEMQQTFIRGAKTMQELGFDAVEINAAGNNIGQLFFSRQRNHRDDEYGPQSFENRARFVGEIIAGIKEECGKDFPVQILFNGVEENDTDIGESDLVTTVEENAKLCKALEDFGADSLHVRLGVFRMHVCQFASDLYFTGYGINGTNANGTRFDFSRHFQGKLDAGHDGYGLMIPVAAEIKKSVSIPVGVVTGNNPAHAPKFFNDVIADGKCDFFLMTRPLTVDTELVNKLREGKLDEIAPCCRCMHCHFDYNDEGKTYEHCRVNACTQRAWRDAMPEGYTPVPAETAKKIMVIGGGPAGMEAARIAAQRGHDVTLYEKESTLGGLLTFAHIIKGPHENLDDFKQYLIRQQELKGVKVVTKTAVDAELIKKEAPDAVILAVGGKRPELPFAGVGATAVIGMDDLARNLAKMGQNVTILGGNAQAVDVAQYLIAQGKHVTMVSPEGKNMLDKGQSSWVKKFTIPMLYANGMRLWPNATLKEVKDGSVVIDGETGCDVEIPCDVVVDARDMLPNTSIIEGLDIPCVAVGDCDKPYNIAEAIAAGNLAARAI